MTDWNIDKEQTTQYLADMVRINSINPTLSPGGAGEGDIAGWLMETCTALGLNVVMQYAKPGRPNVIASWIGKGGGGSILLTGHMDTVGVDNMAIPPFEPTIREGRLYGRGAYDMKGGLAATLGAIKALKEGGFEPKGRIILGFVADEEYASFGTEKMIQELNVDAAILTEPTELKLCIAHRGFAWLKIKTRGRAAHGSLFDEGIDAIAHMGRVLGALERMDAETLSKRSHPLLHRPSVHASLINGGLGLSTYPDEA
ncbi:MAG: M20/M25/M40 family metallo-hydrolase, partial [Phycisphaerales bacterium]|nr:M20/M25/M40 family metallo-hydrolase [Phycisphaerales bacterium]